MRQILLKGGLLVAALGAFLALGAGQALASHVNCGDTITQNTKLDGDLLNCPAAGLVIGADGITLDLNGHTIASQGRGAVPYAGIDDAGGFDEIEIENGTVRGFENGIVLQDVAGADLHHLSVVANLQIGVELIRSDRNAIRQNDLSSNTGFGIYLAGTFFEPRPGSNDNVIEKNTLVGDGGGGVVIAQSDRNVIRLNSLSDDAVGNVAAIAIYGASDNRIETNAIDDNPNFGLIVDSGSSGTLVSRNGANDNSWGIVIANSRDNKVVRNDASENRGLGIIVSSDGNPSGNQIVGNVTRGNGDHGIAVAGTNTLVARNTASLNGDDGIHLFTSGNTVTANRADRNTDYGIESVPGNTDGGRNRARGNGNPEQCLNVRCR